jgi:hypothetical protein
MILKSLTGHIILERASASTMFNVESPKETKLKI